MTWEWSHAPAAYQAARDNLHDLPHDQLVTIMREWMAWDGDEAVPYLDLEAYTAGEKAGSFEDYSEEQLAEAIWEKTEKLRTCDNGGWNAHVCPFGCHTVPMSEKEEAND